ncbi:hypothetical protein PENSTE_c002G07527 [Penicillium steckii]|uniref:Uncharacterized protein n=1 Tax=Penicillium steckii TaxID=303698 RepID=A0A1V6TU34_9EURO|nr:hypothetical protein PENSTE_c002G07527 [Penicillium steckii]
MLTPSNNTLNGSVYPRQKGHFTSVDSPPVDPLASPKHGGLVPVRGKQNDVRRIPYTKPTLTS